MSVDPEKKEDPQQAKPALPEDKAAILVIHGMGQQNPYETLDSFARGLVDHFGKKAGAVPEIEPLLINHENWNEVAIRLHLRGQPTDRGFSTLDLYEFYWAPHTEGKITYLQTLKWLRHTVLTPLRYLGYGYELFSRPGHPAKAFGAFAREILRSLFLFLPVAGFTYALVYLLSKAGSGLDKARKVWSIFSAAGWPDQLLMIAFIALGILTVAILRGLWILGKERRIAQAGFLRATTPASLTVWTKCAVGLLIPVAAATCGLAGYLWSYGVEVWGEIARLHLLWPILALGIAYYLKNVLVGYLGDVAVYVNADAKATSFQARTAILKEAREAILRLLRSPERYRRIVLASHSLGSVIAYDLLNRLLDEVRAPAATGPQGGLPGKLQLGDLEPLQGLLTFGSPLDKIHYFFRTEVATRQAIRGQILSFMHGFRRAPSGRAYGHYRFPHYAVPDPSSNFKWINVWSSADPVSGQLDFYQLAPGTANPTANQFERPYAWYRWGAAHVRYWSDAGFYEIFARELL